MSGVIARLDRQVTEADIETSLRAVGVTSGSIVIVHCSLSELGWVRSEFFRDLSGRSIFRSGR